MGLIAASGVVDMLDAYRLCWISGRFSGGKTSVAFRLAVPFLERGYRLITNCKSVWADPLDDVDLRVWQDGEKPKLRAVCILDEGGLYFKTGRQVEQIAAYAAKMDVVYLIPSFFPPVRAAQVITIQPLFGLRSAGLPLIVYRWRAHLGAFDDKGLFYWWRPSEVYGVYSRQDPGAEPEDIVRLLVDRMEEYRLAYGHKRADDGISDLAADGWDSGADSFDLLSDAANTLAESADVLSGSKALSKGRRRR